MDAHNQTDFLIVVWLHVAAFDFAFTGMRLYAKAQRNSDTDLLSYQENA